MSLSQIWVGQFAYVFFWIHVYDLRRMTGNLKRPLYHRYA